MNKKLYGDVEFQFDINDFEYRNGTLEFCANWKLALDCILAEKDEMDIIKYIGVENVLMEIDTDDIKRYLAKEES